MKSYRLWSLLDMLKKYAHPFVKATVHLQEVKWICTHTIRDEKQNNPEERHRISVIGKSAALLMRSSCSDADMNSIIPQIDRLLQAFDHLNQMPGYEVNSIAVSIRELVSRIQDELDSKRFLLLTDSECALYESVEPPFGLEVQSKFPSASFDISEASKCMALRRYTSSVFHLMRVMEISLHAIHNCLGIGTPITGNDKTWGSILQKIRENYKLRPQFGEMAVFQGLHASLDSVKDAWRNSTMHVENKYTEEEAKHIFAVVKGFMQKLSSRMNEQGFPMA